MSKLQIPDHLLLLLQQATDNYQQAAKPKQRGRPRTYSGLSFLLLAMTAVVLRTFDAIELQRLLLHDARLQQQCGFPAVPHRKTIARRLTSLVAEAEEQVTLLGEHIKHTVKSASLSAVDGRMYQAVGAKWHQKQRKLGLIPPKLRNVDIESAWSKSGYRGWVQGYRLVVQCLVFPIPVPLFAKWVSNNTGESTVLKQALGARSLPVTDVMLGDEAFGGAELTTLYQAAGGWLLTPQQLPKKNHTWKQDLFSYRKEAIELLFQRVIQASDLKQCQVLGNGKNGAFVLVSVWLYQLVFLSNYRQQKPLAIIKEQLDLARWRVPI